MQFYPAIKAYMGDWIYFIVKMRMREVATEVQFGSQVHNDFTLDEAIQRTLNESRVKQELVAYLTGSDDRFFASLVVAAIGGSPKFFPVSITDDPSFKMIATTMEDSFGVLRFDGDQNYYALDGQHRLKAIKSLIHPDIEAGDQNPPKNFANEEISVLMVVRPSEARDDDWLISYRRLFSNLNRYAKPTDKDTNIIMDEDDAFAILTRRLISDHYFFQARGRQQDSHRVLTKGKSLILQLYLLQFELLPTVVAALGHPLVVPPPVRPGQDAPHPARHAQDQAPQEAPDLGQAQPPARPRARLKAARLGVGGLFFWGCGRSRSAARTTASRARAQRTSVTCRYQPCALRTS